MGTRGRLLRYCWVGTRGRLLRYCWVGIRGRYKDMVGLVSVVGYKDVGWVFVVGYRGSRS